MAIYEYYCPTCRDKFEQRRPMSEAVAVSTCGKGHKAERTISAFAAPRGSDASFEMNTGAGGCCGGGGGCACRSAN